MTIIDDEELKPCPFCGSELVRGSMGGYARHPTKEETGLDWDDCYFFMASEHDRSKN